MCGKLRARCCVALRSAEDTPDCVPGVRPWLRCRHSCVTGPDSSRLRQGCSGTAGRPHLVSPFQDNGTPRVCCEPVLLHCLTPNTKVSEHIFPTHAC